MPFDYLAVQKMINFGRTLGSGYVGQPFNQYRLNGASNTDVVAAGNLLTTGIHVKVSPQTSKKFVENEDLHAAAFEMLVSNDVVKIGDILVQTDAVYGGNAAYAVASLRPLKPVMAVRVETTCQIFRQQSGRASGFSGPTLLNGLPFVMMAGVFAPATTITATPAQIPCGIQYVGQLKAQKASHLPMDSMTNWWYIYVPLFPGLTRLRENDIIQHQYDGAENPIRYRVHAPFLNTAGFEGAFLLCERITM